MNHSPSTLLLSFALVCLSHYALSQQTRRVLFLGNSYTENNNLPAILFSVSKSAGDTVITGVNAPGGHTFSNHLNDSNSMDKIKAGNWDIVVLQEQSQLPSLSDEVVNMDVFPYAKQLTDSINHYNPGGEPMFYMTWGRKNGDPNYCEYWPPVCTYEGMDSLLQLRYLQMAGENNALLSPVGAVWRYLRNEYPEIELYQADESHPTLAGTYAAACCFYTSIFRKDPMLISTTYGLSSAFARNIKQAVKEVVHDSLARWNLDQYLPSAEFKFTIFSGNQVTFKNISNHCNSYVWNFGDDSTSQETHPVHTYQKSGTYEVTLIATYQGTQDTLKKFIDIQVTHVAKEPSVNIHLHPNPVDHILFVDSNEEFSIEFYSATGQRMMIPPIHSNGIKAFNFNEVFPGVYLALVRTGGKVAVCKVVKCSSN